MFGGFEFLYALFGIKSNALSTARRRSNVVKEVDRIQKKREERRKQQAEKKEEKEALMNLDPGNPQWEFLNMIREFRQVPGGF